jgi:hypothetical protein
MSSIAEAKSVEVAMIRFLPFQTGNLLLRGEIQEDLVVNWGDLPQGSPALQAGID